MVATRNGSRLDIDVLKLRRRMLLMALDLAPRDLRHGLGLKSMMVSDVLGGFRKLRRQEREKLERLVRARMRLLFR